MNSTFLFLSEKVIGAERLQATAMTVKTSDTTNAPTAFIAAPHAL
jgi:hypothetical protein